MQRDLGTSIYREGFTVRMTWTLAFSALQKILRQRDTAR